jgi:hypothetical protein
MNCLGYDICSPVEHLLTNRDKGREISKLISFGNWAVREIVMSLLAYFGGLLKAILPFLANPWFYRLGAGVSFTAPTHHGHVPGPQLQVKGVYKWLFGRTLMLFHVVDNNYFPQGPAILNPTHKTWEKDVWVGPNPNQEYTIVAAAITPDFMIATNYYGRVHELLLEHNPPIDVWLPFQMFPHQIPPGFIELDRIVVTHPESGNKI